MSNELLLVISASVTAFGVLIAAIISIYRIARRIGDVLGVDTKGRTISDRLDRVEHQLWENGGSSLADRVNNIEKHTIKITTELKFIKEIYLKVQTNAAESNTTSTEIVAIEKSTRRRKRNAS